MSEGKKDLGKYGAPDGAYYIPEGGYVWNGKKVTEAEFKKAVAESLAKNKKKKQF